MNIDEIIATLEHNHDKFPHSAIKRAIEEQEIVIPKLLQVIDESRESIEKINDDPTYMLHIYALYLLAYFRETKAYQPIIKYFSIPGEITLETTGDIVTEDLGRILVSIFDGDLTPIKCLIEDKKVNDYVRSAGLQALCILWSRESLSRHEIIDYYHFLFSDKLVGEQSLIWSLLVSNSINFSPIELEDDINRVFDQGLVEPFFVDRNSVKKSFTLSNDEALEYFKKYDCNDLIGDPISEMQHWACFQPEKKKNVEVQASSANKGKQKIGRNDPCLCGSGKKYKKCCLRI